MSMRPLTTELQKIAEKQLNEFPDRIPQDLEHIREWLLKQPHINARTDDQWLIVFLRGCKFSLERTKEKLEMFYTARSLVPEVLCNKHPLEKKIQDVLNTRFMAVLPDTFHCTQPRMTLVTADKLNPDIHKIQDIWKTITMILDMYFVEEDTLSINGVHAVIDLKKLDYRYLGQATPTFLKKIIMIIQKAYPIRIKKVLVINAHSWVIKLFNTIKFLLNSKLRERFVFCDDHIGNIPNDSHFPKIIEEYCGKDITWDELAIELKCKLEKFRDWFSEDAKYGTDEFKRKRSSLSADEFYGGIQGAFRKLDID